MPYCERIALDSSGEAVTGTMQAYGGDFVTIGFAVASLPPSSGGRGSALARPGRGRDRDGVGVAIDEAGQRESDGAALHCLVAVAYEGRCGHGAAGVRYALDMEVRTWKGIGHLHRDLDVGRRRSRCRPLRTRVGGPRRVGVRDRWLCAINLAAEQRPH